MSTTIPRIYDSYGDALNAANELKKNRFRDDEISLISNAPNREIGGAADPAMAIADAGIPADDVAAFAAVVADGKSLLVVRAVWGAAAKAVGIVDSHGPSEKGVGRREYYASSLADKTDDDPFSDFTPTFGFPTLLDDAAPFSRFWNLPLLLDDSTPFSNWLTFPTLRTGYTFGEPKLIDAPDLFSRELRAPTLWNKSISKELNIPELKSDMTFD